MFGRQKTVQSQASRAVPHVLAAALLVAGLAILMMLTAGMAQACPTGKEQTGDSVTIVRQAKRAVATVSVVFTPKGISQCDGQCCGGGSHSHGDSCAIGCFSAFSAAIASSSGLVPLDCSICHVLTRQDRLASSSSPPDFRPPRTFA